MTESTLYIGTKQVLARPMTRQAYNDYRGWTLPADENGADEGYLVEYVDGGQPNHPAHTGYISWSPKAVFERAYHAQKGMTPRQAAPRVTLADVEASIASEHYFTAREGVAGAGGTAGDALGRLTFCVLVLKNGFMATGKSVCVSSANFDPAVGRQIARENALDEIWPVLGYALLDKLAQEGA